MISFRYEMVFDEDDDDEGPRHSKRRKDHNIEQFDEKRNRTRDVNKTKDSDERRRDPHDGQKQHERNKERQRSPHRGGANDYYREKNGSSGGRNKDLTVRNSRDDRDHKRRHENDDYKHKRDERKYEKRVDDARYGDKKSKIETNEDLEGRHRDRHVRDDNYGHKRRGEERYSDKRSSKGDDRVRRH